MELRFSCPLPAILTAAVGLMVSPHQARASFAFASNKSGPMSSPLTRARGEVGPNLLCKAYKTKGFR